jgi:hypothetical protein
MMSNKKGKKRNFEPDKSLIVKDGSRQAHFKPLMEKEHFGAHILPGRVNKHFFLICIYD